MTLSGMIMKSLGISSGSGSIAISAQQNNPLMASVAGISTTLGCSLFLYSWVLPHTQCSIHIIKSYTRMWLEAFELTLKDYALQWSGLDQQVIVVWPQHHSNEDEHDHDHDDNKTDSTVSLSSTFSSSFSTSSSQSPLRPPTSPPSHYSHSEEHSPDQYSLLVIFPGRNVPGEEYVPIAKVLQKEAATRQLPLVVVIGVDASFQSRLAQYALHLNYGRTQGVSTASLLTSYYHLLAKHAIIPGMQKLTLQSILNETKTMHSEFQNVFLWGHSMGGITAIAAAYPSKYRGLMLYGCNLSCYAALQNATLVQNYLPSTRTTSMSSIKPHKWLASYPKPVLTIMGERDGNIRFYKIAQEAQYLSEQIQDLCRHHVTTRATGQVKRQARLQKPLVVLSELNHMQMAQGVLPRQSTQSGRADFPSRESLPHAHLTLARLVMDFVQVHAVVPSTSNTNAATSNNSHRGRSNSDKSPKKIKTTLSHNRRIASTNHLLSPSSSSPHQQLTIEAAQERLLQLGKITQTIYLEPYLRLTDPTYSLRFLCDIQQRLLHVTTDVGSQKFHFYEEENHEESQHNLEDEPTAPDILPHLCRTAQDFLYSKPDWDVGTNQLQVFMVQQDAVRVSIVPQQSPTWAFKGKSQSAILDHPNTRYHEIKDAPAPTLMELNAQTFQYVLTRVVTPLQRQRYLSEGHALRFGPDLFVESPPQWVTTPPTLTKRDGGYYLWQSPYTQTPLHMPKPFGGAWYGKPLSPAQAYEWIVFDAFKPMI